jgi:uncharacterized protein
MYSRTIKSPKDKSFFLFGPRGTGKSTWVQSTFSDSLYLDLLESELYTLLLASPQRLETLIPPGYDGWVVIDEIQRVPELLNEVHRLIEKRGLLFVLTGSSARKLRRKGVNLLAGRALTRRMHPLTVAELRDDFTLDHSLHWGQMPMTFSDSDPAAYLSSYVHTYLREEVQQEGLTRNLQAFARFLEAASFSQAASLNISEVARECHVNRKLAEEYFNILEDLLLSVRLPAFRKRARRRIVAHPKFFLFDTGVYRTIRPKGILDRPEEIDGAALETLVFQELRAVNDNFELGYDLYYWRTASQLEVDFILYGQHGLIAIEVKRSSTLRKRDFRGLRAFCRDYPMAKAVMIYGGRRQRFEDDVAVVPIHEALISLTDLLIPALHKRPVKPT